MFLIMRVVFEKSQRTQVAKVAVAADPALVRNEVPTPRSSPAATARKTPVVEANWGTGFFLFKI